MRGKYSRWLVNKGTLRRLLLLITLLVVLPLAVIWGYVTQPTLASSERSKLSVNPAALEAHVRFLSEDCHPRAYNYPENLKRASDYIADHFKRAGAAVSFQDYEVNGRTYRNVIGRFGETDGETFVVGAHYDSHGDTPGADDNASGVAGLIELAYLIGQHELGGQRIELVAYCTEEPPFFGSTDMGSYVHAKSLHDDGVKLRGMLALEMIGYFSDEPGSQSFPMRLLRLYYPGTGNFIAVAGKLDQRSFIGEVKQGMKGTTGLPVYSISAPRSLPGIDFSDHRNYWEFGYNAAMITDTAFYRNRNYHEPGDTADTLDYDRMAMAVVVVYESVNDLLAGD